MHFRISLAELILVNKTSYESLMDLYLVLLYSDSVVTSKGIKLSYKNAAISEQILI